MSKFFSFFPSIDYNFGDESNSNLIQNITLYADAIDQIKDEKSAYEDYTIIENMRPDIVSFNLYGSPNFHWTFYFLNNKIREQGWPISNANVLKKAKKDHPNTILTTRSTLSGTNNFLVGDIISGRTSGATAKISHRYLDLGQLVITDISKPFIVGEIIQSNRNTTNTITLFSSSLEFNAAHHYENANKEYVDIDPTVGPGAGITEITYLDRLHSANNDLKQIRVFKENVVSQITQAFREAIAS